MRLKTLGITLVIVGLIGALVAYLSGMFTGAPEYYKVGLLGNTIQFIGLIFIHVDREIKI